MTRDAHCFAGSVAGLQWGHGEFAVDDYPKASVEAWANRLQWGHGEFAVDDGSRRKPLYSPGFRMALRAAG